MIQIQIIKSSAGIFDWTADCWKNLVDLNTRVVYGGKWRY